MRKKVKKLIQGFQVNKLEQDPKVFCISMQRTGTTSTGQFLKDHGFRCVGWGGDRDNAWSQAWLLNDYDKIFNSMDFRIANAYEDSPWWMPEFYKVLDQKFPNSRFILLDREENKWFDSMKSHSSGNTPGAMRVHCKAYNREEEFNLLKQQGLLSKDDEDRVEGDKALKIDESLREHYITCYKEHSSGAIHYFKSKPKQLFYGQLENPNVWQEMAKFLNIKIADEYQAIKNVTATSKRRQPLQPD